MRPRFRSMIIVASAIWLVSCKHQEAKDKAPPDASASESGAVDDGLFADEVRPTEAPRRTVWNLQGYRRVIETPQAPPPDPFPEMTPDMAMLEAGHDPALDAGLDAHGQPLPHEPLPENPDGEVLPADGVTGPREPDAELAPEGTPPAEGGKPADPLDDIGLPPNQE